MTSKLGNACHRPDDARRAFDRTLRELRFDEVDLFLIYSPLPTLYGGDVVSTWRVLEELHRDGPEQMKRIDALDRGDAGRIGGHPDTFAWVPS